MNMRILIVIAALTTGLAMVQTGGEAKARAPLMCRMQYGPPQPANAQNGAPLILAKEGGSFANQNSARNSALQGWSQQAQAFGGQFGNWSNARNKNVNCWTTKPNFQWLYTCRAVGQPCG